MSDLDTKYAEWIEKEYLSRFESHQHVLGRCKEAVEEMVKVFPELISTVGHVEIMGWGRRGHWWCVTESGDVVDPTRTQFPMVMAYEPFVPGDDVRVGKCMNCGDEIWKPVQSLSEEPAQECVCGKECENALELYYNGGGA